MKSIANITVFDQIQAVQNAKFGVVENGVLSDALSRGQQRRNNLRARNEEDEEEIDNGSGGIAHLTRKANAAENKYHEKAKAYYSGTGSKDATSRALHEVSQIDQRLNTKMKGK
jgi:hypothetical protein